MGRTDENLPEEARGGFWFVFPGIYHGLAHPSLVEGTLQCLVIHHFAACGIEEEGSVGQVAQECLVGQVERGPCSLPYQRRVEGEDVTLLLQLAEGREVLGLQSRSFSGTSFVQGQGQGRVVEQDASHPGTACLQYGLSHVSHSHDAQGGLPQVESVLAREEEECVAHILPHAGGVAPRTVRPGNACLPEIGRVKVVETYGGRHDEAHATALQQGTVTVGTRADYEDVGLPDVGGRNGSPRQIEHLVCELLYLSFYVGYLVVNNDSCHASSLIILQVSSRWSRGSCP